MNAAQYSTSPVNNASSTIGTTESPISAVSWPAVLAGTFVMSSVTLILITLGSGLGFSAASVHGNAGVSASTLAVTAVIWLVVVQWIASGLGGYLTGRLRTKWVGTHTHEVFFRDTAHGFLTWAVATVALAVILGSVAAKTATFGADISSMKVSSAPGTLSGAKDLQDYEIDRLFRNSGQAPNANIGEERAEVTRILAVGLAQGDVSPDDRQYLIQLVSIDAGVSPHDAQERVDGVIAQTKSERAQALEGAEKARKAASALAIITALSMVIGAFTACVAAALGGGLRDEHP